MIDVRPGPICCAGSGHWCVPVDAGECCTGERLWLVAACHMAKCGESRGGALEIVQKYGCRPAAVTGRRDRAAFPLGPAGMQELFIRECLHLQQLRHPCIVSLSERAGSSWGWAAQCAGCD